MATLDTHAPVLDWTRAKSGVGSDGRFQLGVFMVRRRLGEYVLEFLPREGFADVLETPLDKEQRNAFLRRKYAREEEARWVSEGIAIGMLMRVPARNGESGDHIVDSVEKLLRESGAKLSKAEILARLNFTDAQWQHFSARRPRTIRLESHGRGARYWYASPGTPDEPRPAPKTPGISAFSSYLGQAPIVNRMKQYVSSAKERGAPLPHVLLSGPPGVGKTTLAQVIAAELGRRLVTLWGQNGSAINVTFSDIRPLDIVFIDEIDGLSPAQQQELFEHMAKDITVIAATNYPGRLSSSLRERFSIQEALEIYSPAELTEIVKRAALEDQIDVPEDVARAIAERSRGSARGAIALVQKVRDLKGLASVEAALEAFRTLEIDNLGLTKHDRRYLSILDESEEGVGIDALASKMGESADSLEAATEPYLLQQELIERTRSGRRITDKGRRHLKPPGRKPKSGSKTETKPEQMEIGT